MGVTRAMLTALLLVLTVSATPAVAPESFLLRQEASPQGEPDLRWDGETEDVYRRALHLWKVRGKPAEAAELLLGIADKAEVLQIAGQSSWVLVLAAQCLAEAGRGEEAAALIPGIERGARGTQLEAVVTAELAHLRGVGGGDLGIDEAFMSSLLELLNQHYPAGETYWTQETQRFTKIKNFGRSILPYFLAAIDRWPSESVGQATVTNALAYGLAMADEAFVDQLITRTDRMTNLGFISVLPVVYNAMDLQAEQARVRYFAHYCRSDDLERRRAAMTIMGKLAFDASEAAAIQEVRQLLADATHAADQHLLDTTGLTTLTVEHRELLDHAAGSPDAATRRAASLRLVRYGELALLGEHVRPHEKEDVVIYLLALNRQYAGTRIHSYKDQQFGSYGFLERSSFREHQFGHKGEDIGPGELPHAGFDGFDFCKPFLGDPEFRTLLALTAIAIRSQDGFDLAYSEGIPSDERHLLVEMHTKSFLPRGFAEKVPSLAAQIGFEMDGLQLLIQCAPESLTKELLEQFGFATLNQSDARFTDVIVSNVREEDVLAIASNPLLKSSKVVAYLRAYMEKVEDWWLNAEPVLRVCTQHPDAQTRLNLEQLVSQALGRVSAEKVSTISAASLLALLQQLEQAGYPCYVSSWLTKTWESAGEAALTRFATSPERMMWALSSVLQAQAWPLTAPLLYALEREVPITALRTQPPGLTSYIMESDPALLEAARILLSRTDVDAQRLGLECLSRSSLSVDGLWDLAYPTLKNPALASWASAALRNSSRQEELLLARLEAWRLPQLQYRKGLLMAIAETADPRVVPTLLEATAYSDHEISSIASQGLIRLKMLEDQRAFWESWQATGVGGSPEAALLKQVRSTNREVRLAAIRALGATRAENALPMLISLLEDADAEVVAAARAALAWLAEPPPPGAPAKSSDSGESGD